MAFPSTQRSCRSRRWLTLGWTNHFIAVVERLIEAARRQADVAELQHVLPLAAEAVGGEQLVAHRDRVVGASLQVASERNAELQPVAPVARRRCFEHQLAGAVRELLELRLDDPEVVDVVQTQQGRTQRRVVGARAGRERQRLHDHRIGDRA